MDGIVLSEDHSKGRRAERVRYIKLDDGLDRKDLHLTWNNETRNLRKSWRDNETPILDLGNRTVSPR